jgi:hypothetical protein
LTHHRAKRDGRGRFVKASKPNLPYDTQLMAPLTALLPEPREVPIEYATSPHLIRWEILGWSAIVLVVVVAIWVMTH